MAQGKKSFLVYLDSRNLVDKLSDERAGKLFKTLLSYCADEDPIVTDEVIDMVFEHFKGILKRDLKRYEAIVERNMKNGLLGGRPKKEQTQNNPVGLLETQNNPNKPDTDTDTDTDTDILLKKETKENTKGEPFNFLNSILALGVDSQIVKDYLNKSVSVNKNKKEREVDKIFIPPLLSDVLSYFEEKGYTSTSAKKAFDYYENLNWHDSKDNPVKNWKSKMISVWLKPENEKKIVPERNKEKWDNWEIL